MTDSDFRKKTTTIDPARIGVTLGPDVVKSLEELRRTLVRKPGVSIEAMELIGDIADGKPHTIPVLLTSMAKIAAEAGAFAKNPETIDVNTALSGLIENLNGFVDNAKPVDVQLHPTREPRLP